MASKLGVSPKIYEHVICMDYINSTFHSCIVMQNVGMTISTWLETNTLTKKDKDQLKKLLKINKRICKLKHTLKKLKYKYHKLKINSTISYR